jgi:hypothetical protein
MCFSIGTAYKQVYRSIVLVFTENDEALVGQRMKWVRDSDFARQNSGIMSCLPTTEGKERLSCIVSFSRRR